MKTHSESSDKLMRTLFKLRDPRTGLTKSQQAYAEVRKAIVTRTLPAGTPLDESLLQSLFPVGRTPLREALKRLAFEGLLSWPSHQAPTVLDVGVHEMLRLYETRRLLEPTVAILAARRSTTDDHAKMIEFCQAMAHCAKSGDVYESVEIDYALHAVIAHSTQNRFLAEASDHLNLQSLRLWYRAQEAHGVAATPRLHTELVEAIISGDEKLAESLAHSHIENSLNRQRTILGEQYVFGAK